MTRESEKKIANSFKGNADLWKPSYKKKKGVSDFHLKDCLLLLF